MVEVVRAVVELLLGERRCDSEEETVVGAALASAAGAGTRVVYLAQVVSVAADGQSTGRMISTNDTHLVWRLSITWLLHGIKRTGRGSRWCLGLMRLDLWNGDTAGSWGTTGRWLGWAERKLWRW
jgi:hypothetical protein